MACLIWSLIDYDPKIAINNRRFIREIIGMKTLIIRDSLKILFITALLFINFLSSRKAAWAERYTPKTTATGLDG
jgi:hypothetical protein